jgi:hypothetical protein
MVVGPKKRLPHERSRGHPSRVRTAFVRSSAVALLLLVAIPFVGCASAPHGPMTTEEIAEANRGLDARLQGSWKIGSFTPDAPLGVTLDAMLAYHKQIMVVHFENGRIRADSPGINFDRRYEVRNADGERFQLVAYDDTGTPQLSYCSFEADGTLRIWMTSPWKGVGTLVRGF